MPAHRAVYRWTRVETSIGPVLVVVGPRGVRRVVLNATDERIPAELAAMPDETICDDTGLAEIAGALRALIDGARRTFPFPLDLGQGTPFQRRVWRELLRVPWGATVTYGELARCVGNPHAARAVGRAVGANPLPVVVPCHRVVASGGKLGGYTGGLAIKRHLLQVEGALPVQK